MSAESLAHLAAAERALDAAEWIRDSNSYSSDREAPSLYLATVAIARALCAIAAQLGASEAAPS